MILYGTMQLQRLGIGRLRGSPLVSRSPAVRSIMMFKMVNNKYVIIVKNKKNATTNIIEYKLENVEKIHCRFIEEGKITFSIKEPKSILLFHGDEVHMVKTFLNKIKSVLKGEDVKISVQKMPKSVAARKPLHPYDPRCVEHVADGSLDSRVLNMRNLVKLVLEKCTLSSLPHEVGNLPIQYLSLSGSKIPSTQGKFNLFWMWMSGDTICKTLKVLELDSINLTSLPFEIFFMKSLSTLSIKNNQMRYLPSFIGEMKKLERLYVSNNLLVYFPFSMMNKQFDVLDISDNKQLTIDPDNVFLPGLLATKDHILKYQMTNKSTDFSITLETRKLSLMSFCVLFDQKIKIKREDIPLTLWQLFNEVSRCIMCHKMVAPDYGTVSYVVNVPNARTLVKNQFMSLYTWQSLRCTFCPIRNVYYPD